MEKIVLASNNKHKVEEFQKMLSNYKVLTLNDIDFYDEIEENGTSFEENALIKAKTIQEYLIGKGLGYIVIADDSGLCVNSLDGAPGIYSARYAGEHGNSEKNREKLLKELEGKDRTAYFICIIAVCYPDGTYRTFEGKTYGEITKEELGSKEFGYDCIFYSKDLNKTFGEATEEEKNSVSHRGRAIDKMLNEM